MSGYDRKTSGIREYNEGFEVFIVDGKRSGRLGILAFNESGCNSTEVDLIDVIKWVKENKPELLENNYD